MRMLPRPLALPVCFALLLVAVACSPADPLTPVLTPRVVVHAVLDPQNVEQTVLVEATRPPGTGREARMDPGDVVAAAGGWPIIDATVIIRGPGTDSVVLQEDRTKRSDGKGAGVYRVRSATTLSTSATLSPNTLRLVPGAVYRLEVRTPQGIVRGETRLPAFESIPTRVVRTFNLDTDTLRLTRASRLSGAAAFFLRRAMPGFSRDDRFERAIDDRLLFPAPLHDNGWAFGPWRAGIAPGTTQGFSVVAVDSNYLKYTVIGADPFGDDVRGNTLRGGVGLFGSVATLADVLLELVADREHPIEGDWVAITTTASHPVLLRLFESPRFPGRGGASGLQLTGTARFADGARMFAEAGFDDGTLVVNLRATPGGTLRRYTGTLDRGVLTLHGDSPAERLLYRLREPGAFGTPQLEDPTAPT